MKFLFTLAFISLSVLCEITATVAQDDIAITLRNFFDVKYSQGAIDYSPVKEKGIPASEHILIVESGLCRDDAKDRDGNIYYFYMVDRSKGIKALITEKTLQPAAKLDENIHEFVELVNEEMKKDGGLVAIIEKFKKVNYVR